MLKALKEEVFEANLDLVRHRLVVFTWGNASGIDRNKGLFVIKPSGVDYNCLKPSDLVVIDMEGRVVEGKLKPSSDMSTHLVLYQQMPSIGGVVHTHSVYATAWAQAGQPIPNLGTTHSDYFAGDIPCTRDMSREEIMGTYETETGKVIVECFAHLNPMEVPGVLVRNHGPFTWGRTAGEAMHHAVVLEQVAKMAAIAFQINPALEMNPSLAEKHYQRKHGDHAYYGQTLPDSESRGTVSNRLKPK